MTPAVTADQALAASRWERGFDAGLRAAREGVLRTEACWPQERRDGYAAGWLRGNGEQGSAS